MDTHLGNKPTHLSMGNRLKHTSYGAYLFNETGRLTSNRIEITLMVANSMIFHKQH